MYDVGKENDRGELLLTYGTDLIGFFLVVMLGFLPLFIVHWADQQPEKRTPPRHNGHTGGMFRALLAVKWANWFGPMRLW